jgi:3-oxoacyl-[acyl-carrier-protein] synthase II
MHRLFEKGPRYASPAEFPNLVPSSPVGHASIYLGVHGPTFSTADLSTSGESAMLQGIELVASGLAQRVVAGSVEERSDIAMRVLVALFARTQAELDAPRSEGGGAVVLEEEEAARARGARVLARVAFACSFRDEVPPLPVPSDAARACVVLPRENGGIDAILSGTAWEACPRFVCAQTTGEHDGLGAVALAAAASRVASGEASSALVCGLAKGRGYALVLESGAT